MKYFGYNLRNYVKTWLFYKYIKIAMFTLRSGILMCGLDAESHQLQEALAVKRRRAESVLEHQYGTALLAWLMDAWFPGLFPDGKTRPQNESGYYRLNDAFIIEMLLELTHDAAESETGDLANDGNRDDAAKREAEENYVEQLSKLLPQGRSEAYRTAMRDFMNCYGCDTDHFGEFSSYVDRFETLLNLALLWDEGVRLGEDAKVGLGYKTSNRDAERKRITGTDDPLDNWALSALIRHKSSNSRIGEEHSEMFKVFWGVLCVALVDSGHGLYEWSDSSVKNWQFEASAEEIKAELQKAYWEIGKA